MGWTVQISGEAGDVTAAEVREAIAAAFEELADTVGAIAAVITGDAADGPIVDDIGNQVSLTAPAAEEDTSDGEG